MIDIHEKKQHDILKSSLKTLTANHKTDEQCKQPRNGKCKDARKTK